VRVHVILFLLTLLTTTLAGALLSHNLGLLLTHPRQILSGLPFSLTLLAILGAHELGHYFVSRHHRVAVSLPYFIPAPPPSLIGTFGAFIRLRSPVSDKRALFDIGVSGPLAGIAVTIPVLLVGLAMSEQMPAVQGVHPAGLVLGESVLFKFMQYLALGSGSEVDVILHPVALAGWLGLLVTSLNLLPVGQLDGGHVAYALLGDRPARYISRFIFVLLLIFGTLGWPGWLIWAGLLYFMGFRHPRPQDFWTPLDSTRRLIGVATLALFLLTFTPVPFGGLLPLAKSPLGGITKIFQLGG
jgi:membrane-associated protease RseP (regulator of RpoE activity)